MPARRPSAATLTPTISSPHRSSAASCWAASSNCCSAAARAAHPTSPGASAPKLALPSAIGVSRSLGRFRRQYPLRALQFELIVGSARVGGRRPAALGDKVALRIVRCQLFQLGKPDGSINLREEFAGAYRGQRHCSCGACPIARQLLGLAPENPTELRKPQNYRKYHSGHGTPDDRFYPSI